MASGASQTVSSKHVLIMDEVDGMAGNEDRGGIQVHMHIDTDSVSLAFSLSPRGGAQRAKVEKGISE